MLICVNRWIASTVLYADETWTKRQAQSRTDIPGAVQAAIRLVLNSYRKFMMQFQTPHVGVWVLSHCFSGGNKSYRGRFKHSDPLITRPFWARECAMTSASGLIWPQMCRLVLAGWLRPVRPWLLHSAECLGWDWCLQGDSTACGYAKEIEGRKRRRFSAG